MRRFALFAFALFAVFRPTEARAENAPFAFSGPLSSLLPAGREVAPHAAGIPFAIEISAGGQRIEAGPFALLVPGATKPFRLTLTGAAFSDGKLTAKATLTNASGAALEGLRLDLTQATETFNAKDAQGKLQSSKRPRTVVATPLHFGDLGAEETSDSLPLEATGLSFSPETVRITVRGVVSGLRYEKTLSNPSACGAGQIEVDERGSVYLADVCARRIARISPTGEVSGIELPANAKGFARDPRSGRLAATYGHFREIQLIGAEEQVLGTLGDVQGLDALPDFLRFDSLGRLWVEADGTILRFGTTGRREQRIRTIGDFGLGGVLSFDLAPSGALWVVARGALYVLPADGRPGSRVVEPGLRPGELTSPEAPRAASDGSVWVVEGADPTHGAPERISVFDRAGRLVRIFGRGAKAPLPGFPAAYHEAQIFQAKDLAFGPENRVYVAGQRPGKDGEVVVVFRSF